MGMTFAVLTLAYNEEDTINAVMKNWDGKVDKHLVLHSAKPWCGDPLPKDNTKEIVEHYKHAEFIQMNWKSEAKQRNWGLAYLYDYDYVLIVDADELYTEDDIKIILDRLENPKPEDEYKFVYRIKTVKTYFKTLDYRLDPVDTHLPIIAVDPKNILFREHRFSEFPFQAIIPVTMHHLSYARGDEKMKTKFKHFSHADDVKENWYDNVYKQWEPGSDMIVRAYGHEKSIAIKDPAPDEIKQLTQ